MELGWDLSAADKRLLAFIREDLALPDGSTIATMTAASERLGLRAFDATEIVSLSAEVQRLAEAVAARASDEEQLGGGVAPVQPHEELTKAALSLERPL